MRCCYCGGFDHKMSAETLGVATAGNDANPNSHDSDEWWASVESACHRRWSDARLHAAEPDDARPKKFITVAYPYPNSPQHVGHGRTYTLADVHARFWRLRGYNVLFPMGFHYTGTPILGMARRVQEKDAELIRNLRDIYGVPESEIERFSDPLTIARYFHDEIKMGMKEMGYSIDWRREFTTIDPGYSKFVEWQISTLRRQNLIIQGSHPVGWCPKDQNPVSQHDTLGDVEPAFTEYVMIKFRVGEYVVPVATLRPETIFGVTNLWVNPDISYRKITVLKMPNGDTKTSEKWIVSAECAHKLGFLGYEICDDGTITGSELAGKTASAPIVLASSVSGDGHQDENSSIPVLPARFVTPATGTGVVMSVPAHAPYDWQALQDVIRDNSSDGTQTLAEAASSITPVSIIKTPGYGEIPARDAVSAAIPDCSGQSDSRLESVTKDLYSKEFYEGVMLHNNATRVAGDGLFARMPVKEAKDAVGRWLAESGHAAIFLEIADAPVRCRCGSECVVKMLSDQWFLNYGDADWKKSAHRCLDGMQILPDEIRQEFGHVVDWLHERACARQHGLGTKLPWDKNWIVESLSDSVIYMAYYTIARFVNAGVISPEQMTPAFFDYVLTGPWEAAPGRNTDDVSSNRDKAEPDTTAPAARALYGIPADILSKIRREFEYFYPVDYRHSGRDLVPNHLTFFVLNHVAIFAQEMWPRGIVVNGSVLMDGSKMSKSMGNIIPLRKAIKEFGADPIRLAIIISAELLQDADFNMESVHGMRARLEALHAECVRLGGMMINQHMAPNDKCKDDNDKKAGSISSCRNDKPGACLQYGGLYALRHDVDAQQHAEDAWAAARMRRLVASVTESMEKMRLRESLHLILYEADSILQWHARRAAAKGRSAHDVCAILHAVMGVRIIMLRPFAPHVTEPMWNALRHAEDALDASTWPAADGVPSSLLDQIALQSEFLLESTLDDVASILKVTKMTPSRIVLYVSQNDSARRSVYGTILQSISAGNTSMKDVMSDLMSGPHAKAAKRMPDYIQKAIKDILSDPVEIRAARLAMYCNHSATPGTDNDNDAYAADMQFSEQEFLRSEMPGMASAMFGARVDVYAEDEPGIYDPKSKARHARPFKPAILIE